MDVSLQLITGHNTCPTYAYSLLNSDYVCLEAFVNRDDNGAEKFCIAVASTMVHALQHGWRQIE